MNKASLLFAFALAACAPAFAADAAATPNRFAATITPAERFEVGALLVERHGSGGRPLVLIPGLASGSWAWQDTVRAFSGKQAVYVVTLPGFDGRAPAEGNVMDAARKALRELITSRKLNKPVLVGHSLGGTLAIAVAEDAPDLVGGVIAVDGLPVMPGTEDTLPAVRAQMAGQIKARMAAADAAAFAQQQHQYMHTIGVLDMSKGDALAELSGRSNPASVASAAAEDIALDLRPGLSHITAPVLVVAPFFEADAAQYGMTESSKAEYYKSLMDGTPKLEVVTISPSRHFVMFDQPQKLVDAIRSFVSKL
jgi:pimeloyl-ACP methyl ester carboxylesterase